MLPSNTWQIRSKRARCGDTCNTKFVKMYFTPGAPSLSLSGMMNSVGGGMLPSLLEQNEVWRMVWLSGHLMILNVLP